MTDTPPPLSYQRRKERAARDLANSESCAKCGYARINVVHEQDPEHAPEGMDYYRDFLDQLHPFEPLPLRYWHGGGRITGDMVLPGSETGHSRSGASLVHITSDRSLAETYASTVDGRSWVYEVEPVGPVVPVPSLVGGPTISYQCDRAVIIRRFTLSNARRAVLRAAVPSW